MSDLTELNTLIKGWISTAGTDIKDMNTRLIVLEENVKNIAQNVEKLQEGWADDKRDCKKDQQDQNAKIDVLNNKVMQFSGAAVAISIILPILIKVLWK